MKNPAFLPFPVLIPAACVPVAKSEAQNTACPARPLDYHIYDNTWKMDVPRPFEIIGAVLVAHHIE
jgi:hypothetical protein